MSHKRQRIERTQRHASIDIFGIKHFGIKVEIEERQYNGAKRRQFR